MIVTCRNPSCSASFETSAQTDSELREALRDRGWRTHRDPDESTPRPVCGKCAD